MGRERQHPAQQGGLIGCTRVPAAAQCVCVCACVCVHARVCVFSAVDTSARCVHTCVSLGGARETMGNTHTHLRRMV